MLTLASVKPHVNTARRFEKRINKTIVKSAVNVIDKVYKDRDYARFYVLETVARVPYFSFVSVLHLYETLSISRKADFLETHFAQTMNEYHHLLIMEDLGGDERFVDRFFAQHTAFAYYWLTCLLYVVSPRMAYNLSEQVEEHAYHTYDEFLKQNGVSLSLERPPAVAVNYYEDINNLYDVFVNVRNDEGDHVKTMQDCQLELDER
jgi:ubiquinol oxidase